MKKKNENEKSGPTKVILNKTLSFDFCSQNQVPFCSGQSNHITASPTTESSNQMTLRQWCSWNNNNSCSNSNSDNKVRITIFQLKIFQNYETPSYLVELCLETCILFSLTVLFLSLKKNNGIGIKFGEVDRKKDSQSKGR